MWSSRLWARTNLFTNLWQTRGFRGVHSVEQFSAILERERARADRNEHQFSVVVFETVGAKAHSAEAQHLAHVLIKRIRFTDQGWAKDRLIVVLGSWPTTPVRHWVPTVGFLNAMSTRILRDDPITTMGIQTGFISRTFVPRVRHQHREASPYLPSWAVANTPSRTLRQLVQAKGTGPTK